MALRRPPNWLLFLLSPFALLFLAIASLRVFMSVTATPIHPKSNTLPSVIRNPSAPRWTPAATRARQVLRAGIVEQNLPGLSVAVGVGGELVWAEGFGYADLQSSTPVTPEHRFPIGTASISLTAAAAGRLLETGRLRLDSEIQTYVPAFPKKQWPVTVRHLMSHTSGLVNDGGDESPLYGDHCDTPPEAIPHFAQHDLQFQPGIRFAPSRYGYVLVAAAIEAASQQPFHDFLRDQVLLPLGMRDTLPDGEIPDPESEDFPLFNMFRELFHDPAAKPGNTPRKPSPTRVTAYFPRFSSDPKYGFHLTRPLDLSCYAGSSGLLATPSDLVRFLIGMQTPKILQPATISLLQTRQRLASGEEIPYALGWTSRPVSLGGKSTRMLGHNGDSLGGLVSSLLTFPDQGIVIAVTANASYADTYALGLQIAEAFAGAAQ